MAINVDEIVTRLKKLYETENLRIIAEDTLDPKNDLDITDDVEDLLDIVKGFQARSGEGKAPARGLWPIPPSTVWHHSKSR